MVADIIAIEVGFDVTLPRLRPHRGDHEVRGRKCSHTGTENTVRAPFKERAPLMLQAPSGAKAVPADANKHTFTHTLQSLRACAGLKASSNTCTD